MYYIFRFPISIYMYKLIECKLQQLSFGSVQYFTGCWLKMIWYDGFFHQADGSFSGSLPVTWLQKPWRCLGWFVASILHGSFRVESWKMCSVDDGTWKLIFVIYSFPVLTLAQLMPCQKVWVCFHRSKSPRMNNIFLFMFILKTMAIALKFAGDVVTRYFFSASLPGLCRQSLPKRLAQQHQLESIMRRTHYRLGIYALICIDSASFKLGCSKMLQTSFMFHPFGDDCWTLIFQV